MKSSFLLSIDVRPVWTVFESVFLNNETTRKNEKKNEKNEEKRGKPRKKNEKKREKAGQKKIRGGREIAVNGIRKKFNISIKNIYEISKHFLTKEDLFFRCVVCDYYCVYVYCISKV